MMFRRLTLAAALLTGAALPAFADGLAGAPAPFDKGGVKIALVGYISGGDFFEAFQSGAQRQAKALGVDLRIFPGKQDAALEREQIEQAINLGVKAIVIDHGLPESLKDVAQKALDAGIKVVALTAPKRATSWMPGYFFRNSVHTSSRRSSGAKPAT